MKSTRERPEVIQDRVARRLGHGDAEVGWELLGMFTDTTREYLIAMERRQQLSEANIEYHRSHVLDELRRAQT